MGKHGLTHYPYEFMLEYKKLPVECIYDNQSDLYYVMHNGKKLYFKGDTPKDTVFILYLSLLIEQDIRAPHRYVNDYSRLKGKTLLDIGSAEGIFSLDVIELVKHVYLFECDKDWITALNATFAPWKDKITIVEKYVSDINDESNITIDRFLEGKDKSNLFLKMDIEGYEQAALRGAANTLKAVRDLDYSICTYHCPNDAEEIHKTLSDNHFESEFTDGFFYWGRTVATEPRLRKAIIRRKVQSI
ncbi:hypothetical protein AGMMS49982_16810 [Bacteroidia bacterium]|nr:hypothetical protein AGMMS49982_16810 [Bacteroidia bacterium]